MRFSSNAVSVVGVFFCSACYGYVPVHGTPPVGAHVGIEVNDEGRVALRDRLGPGVLRLEGRLAGREGEEWVVDASRVTQLRGLPLPLDSMRLRLSQRFVERMDERRLSRTRTWMLVGGAASVVAAFGVTKGFTSRGTPPEEPPGGPPTNERWSPVFGVAFRLGSFR
jgi:hypothetical protein